MRLTVGLRRCSRCSSQEIDDRSAWLLIWLVIDLLTVDDWKMTSAFRGSSGDELFGFMMGKEETIAKEY